MFRRLALAFVLACLAALASPAPAADAAPSSAPVKYYVVRDAFRGQPEFLFEIAQRFLGAGDRNNEIFELNKGRLQPDGLRMTKADAILPGWILQLPSDAKGNGVQTGPLPTVAPSAEPTAAVAPAPETGGSNWWKWGILAVGGVLLLGCAVAAWRLRPRKAPPAPSVTSQSQTWMDTDRYYSVDEPAPAPPARPDRRPALLVAGLAVVALAVLATGVFLVATAEDPARPVAATPAPDRLGPRIGTGDPTLCLAATSADEGAPLVVKTCDGTITQQWQVASDGTVRTAGMCMDVAGAVKQRGTVVQLAVCNGNKAQQFQFDGDRLVSELSGYCVDVRANRVVAGQGVIIGSCKTISQRPWKQLP
jgi:ricin-type beta-trefoil lectin protein